MMRSLVLVGELSAILMLGACSKKEPTSLAPLAPQPPVEVSSATNNSTSSADGPIVSKDRATVIDDTSTFGTALYRDRWDPQSVAFSQCHEVPQSFGCSDEGGGGTDSYVTGYTLYGSTTPLSGWTVQECDPSISTQVSASVHDENSRLAHCLKLEDPKLHRGIVISKFEPKEKQGDRPAGLPRDVPVNLNVYLSDAQGHITGPKQSYSGNDTETDDRNGYSLEAICDVNGDGVPEIIIRNEHYYGFNDEILQFDKEISDIHETNHSVHSAACGC